MPAFSSLRLSNGHVSLHDMPFPRGKEEKERRKRNKLPRHSYAGLSRSVSSALLPKVCGLAEDSTHHQPHASWSPDQSRSLHSKSTGSSLQDKQSRSDTALDRTLHPDRSHRQGRPRVAMFVPDGPSRAAQAEIVERGHPKSPTDSEGRRASASERGMRTFVHFDSSDESLSDDADSTISALSEHTPGNAGNHWRRFFPEISSHFSQLTVASPVGDDRPQAGYLSPLERIVSKSLVQSIEPQSRSSSSSQETLDSPSSCYSRRSSTTSVDSESPRADTCQPMLRRSPSEAYSVISPVAAGVFDNFSPAQRRPTKVGKGGSPIDEVRNKPLPLEPPIEMAPLFVRRRSRVGDRSPVGKTRDHRDRAQRLSIRANSKDLDVPDDDSSPETLPRRRYSRHTQTLSQAAQALEDELSKLTHQLGKSEESPAVALDQPLQISRGNMDMIATRPPPTPPSAKLPVKAASPPSPVQRTGRRRSADAAAIHEATQPKKPGKHKLNFSFSVRRLRKSSDARRSFSIHTPGTVVEDSEKEVHVEPGKALGTAETQPLGGSVESSRETAVSDISSSAQDASPPRSSSSSSESNLRRQLPRPGPDQPQHLVALKNPTHTVCTQTDMELPSQLTGDQTASKTQNEDPSSSAKIVAAEEDPKRYRCPNCSQLTHEVRVLERKPRPRLDRFRPLSNVFELDAGLPSPSIRIVDSTEDSQIVIPVDAPERVILTILENLGTLEDLFNSAILNRSFYTLFKRHELSLIKNAVFSMSPTAWELREMSPPWGSEWESLRNPDAPVPEYTPTLYLRHHTRDIYTLVQLKTLILARCGSFLRRDTVRGLAGVDEVRAAEIDEAFWRIWTFCRIFGCGKNRETDIEGQMDWLNGGRLARRQGGGLSTFSSEPFAMNNVLLEPPAGFARGNGDGLLPGQLYDMTEIWTCLGVLLQAIHGKCSEARRFGVYDGLDFKQGDIEKEEAMLEEWTYYALTLGPSAVLNLSSVCPNASPEATFSKAQQLGLTKWEPPERGTSRGAFLKEAVSRVYQTRVSGHGSPRQQQTSRAHSREPSPVMAPANMSSECRGPSASEGAQEARAQPAACAVEAWIVRRQQQWQPCVTLSQFQPSTKHTRVEVGLKGHSALIRHLMTRCYD
ncbi:hypothetical protein VTN02DRAFT_6478 [Thermoascus thermophilus]